MAGNGIYRWSRDYPVLYSTCFETALIKITLSDGSIGYGEAQAPLAPEVVCTIIDRLLVPALAGEEFDGTPTRIVELWDRMYSTMRVRGQTGGFMLDAISGVDLALWDLAGKLAQKPVCELLAEWPQHSVPAYLSGVVGASPSERAEYADRARQQSGIELVKLYYESDWEELLRTADALLPSLRFAVDALWHLPSDEAIPMSRELDARNAVWLECPLYPEDVEGHRALATAISTPLAIGESYRTVAELRPFLQDGIVSIVQPDLGRSGITESRRIAAAHGGRTIPHVSIAMGPQIAAAVHFCAATPNAGMCEFNPNVLAVANSFLAEPIELIDGEYQVPRLPGLGVVWNPRASRLLDGWLS